VVIPGHPTASPNPPTSPFARTHPVFACPTHQSWIVLMADNHVQPLFLLSPFGTCTTSNMPVRSVSTSLLLLTLTLAASLMLISRPDWSQSPAIVAIDNVQNKCLNEANTTFDMKQCLTVAEQSYDVELNKSFKEAIKSLDPVSANLFAQRTTSMACR